MSNDQQNEQTNDQEPQNVLPALTIEKFIKDYSAENLPDNIRFSKSYRQIIQSLASEFITHLTQQASSICEKQAKSVINSEHVLQTLQVAGYGFENYFEKCQETAELADQKNSERKKKKSKFKSKVNNMTEEEALLLQQKLMEEAARNLENEEMEEEQKLLMQSEKRKADAEVVIDQVGDTDVPEQKKAKNTLDFDFGDQKTDYLDDDGDDEYD